MSRIGKKPVPVPAGVTANVAGQLVKMVNQICIAGIVQGMSEGLFLAIESGLDAKKVARLVAQGAGGSWQLANRADTMVDGRFDFGFAVEQFDDLDALLDANRKIAQIILRIHGEIVGFGNFFDLRRG